jgi:hypothetical protein
MKKMHFLSIKVILMLLCIVPFFPNEVMSQVKTQNGASINFYSKKSKKAISLSELKEGIYVNDRGILEKIIISPSKSPSNLGGKHFDGGLVIKIYDTNNNNDLVFLVKIQSLYSNYVIPLPEDLLYLGNSYTIEVRENNKVIIETTYDTHYSDGN